MSAPIAFIDLQAQRAQISGAIDAAIGRVLEHGRFIFGPEVMELEAQLAAYCGAHHALGCANGTEALVLPLMAWDLRPGDAVFCPSFTFTATAEVIPWLGASPVFVDVDPVTYNMAPRDLEAAIQAVKAGGTLRPRVVIAVDLFGQPADYPALKAICDAHGLKLIADSAQGFGCTLAGKHPMAWADCVTTSFFPAKPLGCYGDGGMIFTNDADLGEAIDSLRVHGRAMPGDLVGRNFDHDPKYLNTRIGMNSRLDSIQAAILLQKMTIFDAEIEARNRIAARYNAGLAGHVAQVPGMIAGGMSVWAQYTIESDDRDALIAHLKGEGVPTAVYYPVPMHQQTPYARWSTRALPVTESKSERVLSLPMHPYLDDATQDRIIAAVARFQPARVRA